VQATHGLWRFLLHPLPVYQRRFVAALQNGWTALMWNAHSRTRRGEGERPWQQRTAPRRGGGPSIPTTRRDDDDVDGRAASWAARSYVLAALLRTSCIRGSELKADADGGVDARAIELDRSAAAAARFILIRCSVNVMARPWPFRFAGPSGNGRKRRLIQ
jgi:hypothetical protein